MLAKAREGKDQVGALTPKKMLDWGILQTWRSCVEDYKRAGPISLDTKLLDLQQLVANEPQDPGDVTKDYFMAGFALANQVEHYMQAGAVYAQVIKGYMYEHIFQYHQVAFKEQREPRNWDQFVHEELGVRKSTAHEYRRLWLLVFHWVRLSHFFALFGLIYS